MHAGAQEGFLLGFVDVGTLQSFQNAHGDLIVVGEDVLGRGDLVHSGGFQPLGEELLALGAAPAGVGGGWPIRRPDDKVTSPCVALSYRRKSFENFTGEIQTKNLPPSHLLPGTAVFCHSSKLLPNKGSPCSANSQFTRNTHPSRRFSALSISCSSGHARYRRLSRSAVVFLRPRANWLMSCSVSRTFPPRKIRLTLASGIPLAVASSFCVMPSFWRSAWICLARADCSFLL